MVWVESPTNPLLKLVGLAAIAEIARRRNLISVCDNTFCSPWVQRPLDHGFDIVMHRSEEHTSEFQSLMRISYAVFCLQKKIIKKTNDYRIKSDRIATIQIQNNHAHS